MRKIDRYSLIPVTLLCIVILGMFWGSIKVKAAGINFKEAEHFELGETKEDLVKENAYYTGYYMFDVDERTTIDIKTVCEVGGLELLIYNSDGDEIYSDETSGVGTLGMVTDHFYITLNQGRYYLIFNKNWYNGKGDIRNYSFILNKINEYIYYNYGGQTIEKSNDIEINSTLKSIIYGCYIDKYCVDYYKVYIPKKTNINVKVSTENGCVLHLKWYDSEKELIDEQEFNGAKSCQYIITLPIGEYYFSVDNSTNIGNHSFWYRAKLIEAQPKLNKTTCSIKKGDTLKLRVTNFYENDISWKSSNKNIATVSESGLVRGKKKGRVVITAFVGGEKLKCKIVIK